MRTPKKTQGGDRSDAVPNMPPPLAEVRREHGIPTLSIAGRLSVPVAVDLLPETPPTVITNCASFGVPWFRLRGFDLSWIANGRFDYATLDARLDAFASACNVPFVLEVSVDAPEWWCASHVEECVAYAAPTGGEVAPVASWASGAWRGEAGDALSRLVRHVRQHPAGARCIGFQIACGIAGEWRHPHAEQLPDVGTRMTERFRAYLADKYRRNQGLLKQGWDDPRASFVRIRCPGAEERRSADMGIFRSPVRSRRLLDYYETFYTAQNDAALHFARLVKRSSEGQALVGISYATIFDHTGSSEDCHGLPEPVLESADIDFIANRGPRSGGYLRALNGSVALRGKLLLHVVAGGDPSFEATLAWTGNAGAILSAETDSNSLQQIVGFALQRQKIGMMKKAEPQVAVITDPASATYLQRAERAEWLNGTGLTAQAAEIARMGAPCDVYMLADLFRRDFPDHKVYLCPNLYYLSEAERRRLDARVKRSEQVVVWGWAAGIAGEEGVDTVIGHRTTGVKLRMEPKETELRARIVEAQDPVTWGFHPGAHFGTSRAVAPTITVTDKNIVRLGANSDNKTVFAALRTETWTGVYCGALPISSRLLANVLRMAGCHLYTDPAGSDAHVVADAGSAAIYTTAGGEVMLSLPGVTELTELISGEHLSPASDFKLRVASRTTSSFLLRPTPRKR
jgi:hypothetical protein